MSSAGNEIVISADHSMTKKQKLFTASLIWYCTFTLGLGVSFLGSSLIELSQKFGTDIATVSKVFTVITASFLVGAITCGIVFNYVNRQAASAILLILMGVGTICLPLSPSLYIFFFFASLVGFSGGGYDTAQIVWIIEMFNQNSAIYIQIQHTCFALGTLVSPLLIKPFLSTSLRPEDKLPIQYNVFSEETNSTVYYSKVRIETYENSLLFVPFLIGGLAAIVGGALLLLMFFIKRYEKPRVQGENSNLTKSYSMRRIVLILLSAVLLGSYQAMELSSMQFLPTFTHFINLKLNEQEGALVLSALSGAFVLGRVLGIFLVLRILPQMLLLGNVVLITIGNCLLYFFSNDSLPLLWLSCVFLGVGFSTVFPSFYGYIEKHLKVSNLMTAIMIVAGGLISGVYPIIIGTHIQKNPFVLTYTNFFSLGVCVIFFSIIFFITNSKKENIGSRRNSRTDSSAINSGENKIEIPLRKVK